MEEAGPSYLNRINKSARFEIEPLDTMAAIEAAAMFRLFKSQGDKRGGATGDWQKVKIDQQIVAIARSRGASCIYCSDEDIQKIADRLEIQCVPVWRLPLPEEDTQGSLFPAEDEAQEPPIDPSGDV